MPNFQSGNVSNQLQFIYENLAKKVCKLDNSIIHIFLQIELHIPDLPRSHASLIFNLSHTDIQQLMEEEIECLIESMYKILEFIKKSSDFSKSSIILIKRKVTCCIDIISESENFLHSCRLSDLKNLIENINC